ncbi:MAG: RNA methyltransferase [Muribaculaceae bacterium]|nr:RNA methyltransferase [Muribaculaceae bacterium]
MSTQFEMVAKTFAGLENVLAEELRGIGAQDVQPGKRMVSFSGNLETLYRANFCCRTALRILKPFYKFAAADADELYEKIKEYDWSSLMDVTDTFAIDSVVNSDEFTHSRFVTYRVKDGIVDWFQDRLGAGKRPGVRLDGADILINVHIAGREVTLSLDSSGESLHKRGYRVAQTEAPINEVLAAGIILMTGWRGETPFVDPMCGSGTFLCEAALIAGNINPGIFRRGFAFEKWPDFNRELFEEIYHDDSAEREISCPIIGADISPKAVAISKENLKSAGVARYVTVEKRALSQWEEAPADGVPGVLVSNPPYGERISAPDMDALYETIGNRLKNVFKGYHAWIIGYKSEYFDKIGLAASERIPLYNGALECQLREYVIFEGNKRDFLAAGNKLKERDDRKTAERDAAKERRPERRGEFRKGDSRKSDFQKGDARRGEMRASFVKDGFAGGKGRGASERKERGGRERNFSRDGEMPGRGVHTGYDKRPMSAPETPSENPLAMRRNPSALKSISGKAPSLPAADGPIMRSRGWRKKNNE